jgi:hypothetical protein
MIVQFLLEMTFVSLGTAFGYKLGFCLSDKEPKADENRQVVYSALYSALFYALFKMLSS